MTSSEFQMQITRTLESLPSEVTNTRLSEDDRKLGGALIHLNTNLYPALENAQTLLEILRMEHGYEKLRVGMLWNMAMSQTSPAEMRAIVELMDYYLRMAVASA
jgi:hypothetical protein